MCQCSCPRLHVDQLGPIGRAASALAWDRLEWLERRNGCEPDLPAGTIQFLEMLSARVSATPGEKNLWVDSAAAASVLGVSESRVRWLAGHGCLPGSVKIGQRAWLIPRSALEYRRSRVA
jgi:hypothetical protein